jgi:hypothetical protein
MDVSEGVRYYRDLEDCKSVAFSLVPDPVEVACIAVVLAY